MQRQNAPKLRQDAPGRVDEVFSMEGIANLPITPFHGNSQSVIWPRPHQVALRLLATILPSASSLDSKQVTFRRNIDRSTGDRRFSGTSNGEPTTFASSQICWASSRFGAGPIANDFHGGTLPVRKASSFLRVETV
jgi:hypothetical protein